jgi:hypothetical protein
MLNDLPARTVRWSPSSSSTWRTPGDHAAAAQCVRWTVGAQALRCPRGARVGYSPRRVPEGRRTSVLPPRPGARRGHARRPARGKPPGSATRAAATAELGGRSADAWRTERHLVLAVAWAHSLSKNLWRRADLNCRPRAYETPALPLSYPAKGREPKSERPFMQEARRGSRRPGDPGFQGSPQIVAHVPVVARQCVDHGSACGNASRWTPRTGPSRASSLKNRARRVRNGGSLLGPTQRSTGSLHGASISASSQGNQEHR